MRLSWTNLVSTHNGSHLLEVNWFAGRPIVRQANPSTHTSLGIPAAEDIISTRILQQILDTP